MIYNYIIYHKGCFDGFTSFIILENSGKISKNAKIYPDVPSTTIIPKEIEDKDVIIMDVAYKYDILKEIFYFAKSVVFIDHHITIRNDVLLLQEKIGSTKPITIVYDVNECGATLTWNFLNGDKTKPLFLKYIFANDTGKWDMYKNTLEFISALEVNYKPELNKKNLIKWKKLFNDNVVNNLIKKGKKYREYIDHLINVNINKYTMMIFPSEKIYEEYNSSNIFTKPGQYKVALTFNTCPNISQLGNKMMKEINCDFVMFVSPLFDKKEYIISLRSDKINIGDIAKLFGGGGHNSAAAFSLHMNRYNISDLFFETTLPRERRK
jgi:oligoribonuclease NrnB/cAMP/cGMP phosphodiesterase (DHH superfamily)